MYGKRGSMLLCLGNLPPQVTRKDLKGFVREVVAKVAGSRSPRISPRVPQCSILRVTNTATGQVMHQCLIAIQPAKVALEAMPILQQTPFRGSKLEVRRYSHCSFQMGNVHGIANIGDLLGLGTPAVAGRPSFKLDLVSTTGASAKTGARPMRSPAPAGILAH